MVDLRRTMRFHFWLWLIRVIGVIVPRRLRGDWRQEWEAELQYRETLLAEWGRLGRRNKLALLWHSVGAFADAIWLQPRRMEDEMFQDLRYGARMLLKNPGYTLVAILTLALGIGANTAIFSVVNAVMLRPLPYSEPERLVQVWETKPRANRWADWVSYPDFQDWRERNTVFDEIGACRTLTFNLTGGDSPESLPGAYVSASLFTVLGVKPILGRTFLDEEDRPGANRVAVISHGLWRRRFGADPGLIGKTIQVDGESHVVVGIMPPDFKFHWLKAQRGFESDIWLPQGPPSELQDRFSHNFRVVARLKRNVTIEQAQANMDVIARGVSEREPGHKGMGAEVMSLQRKVTKDAKPALLLLSVAIGLVLLIACGNRSEEHTSELQSLRHLVCRLLLE